MCIWFLVSERIKTFSYTSVITVFACHSNFDAIVGQLEAGGAIVEQ